MTVADISQARDDILTFFKEAWDAGEDSEDLLVIYDDVKKEVPKDGAAWARVTVRHNSSVQSTLSGQTGKRRFEKNGTITVQIFTPYGKGLSLSDNLAIIAVDAFEGKATDSGIWFRNVRANEIGNDGPWFQTNVIAEFIYDQIK